MDGRRYPKFPIPGVGIVVIGSQGILLVRRHKEPGKGLWSTPGGAIEVGETQKQTAMREVLEETGITCEVVRFLATRDVIIPDNDNNIEFHFLLNFYLAKAQTGSIRREFPEAEVAWFQPTELPINEMPAEIADIILSSAEHMK